MKRIKYFLLFTALLLAVSCGKNFDNINVDPNNPSVVPVEYLLTAAEKDLADLTFGEMNAWFGLLVAQYWSQNNYTDESRYRFRPEAVNERWGIFYAHILKDLAEIIELASASEDSDKAKLNNQIAIARVLKAYTYHIMTDVWGSLPYDEALLGAENRTPQWNSQEEIYLALLQELKDAVKQMDDGAESFSGGDIIYKGDVSKWKKFAHSLIMRVALRMSDVPEVAETARIEVESAHPFAFKGNEDNATFQYLPGAPNYNPLYHGRITRCDADFGMSDVLIDKTLKPLNDPRLAAFADLPLGGGDYAGRPFGQSSDNAAAEEPAKYSQPSGAAAICHGAAFKPADVLAPDFHATFMNYAEVCFILAEAKERGWNVPGTAAGWYEAGVTASILEWGSTEAVAGDYLAQPDVAFATASGVWKQKIGVQKWIALYMQGIQGWAEWRRLDFDKLVLPKDPVLQDVGDKAGPVRLTFPTNEQSQNSAGYQQGVGLLKGPDNLTTKLWWDVE